MGMFDYISFEDGVNLPLPEEMKALKRIEYQTKSLDRAMHVYLIGKDGHLYLTDSLFEDNNEPKEKKKIDYHGIIDFGAYEFTDDLDYSVDFEAKFTDGVLQKIELTDFKKIEHRSAKEKREELLKRQEAQNKRISNRISRAIKDFIIFPALRVFGLHPTRFDFTCPEIVFLYKSDDIEKNYGLFFNNISTGIRLKKTQYMMDFTCKFLGFGFVYQNFNLGIFK
jgi:hypothetical protein